MLRTRLLLLLALACSAASAHWTEHPELPDWAQRGRLHWGLNYARVDKPLVDLFVKHGQTLIHGSTFDSPETAAYAAEQGLGLMPYVCSRTFRVDEMEREPALRGAPLLNPDGSEFLAYNNPVRRYGSLFVPAWPEYVRGRTRAQMDKPDVVAMFYDNVYVNDDHRPEAIAAWQAWAREHGLPPGDDMPSIREGELAPASRWFNRERLVDYYAGLRAFNHAHDPKLPIAPNLGSLPGYGMAIIEENAADLVFYETMSHPPFENNALRYKIGLAASHGRPTGILAYLPWRIAEQRGEKTWNETMHHDFYPSSPLPQEFALAVAEAVAVGGTYIPCYNLFPSLPITDLGNPFHQRIHRELERSYDFVTANEGLFAAARPAGTVGLLYSSTTTLHDRRLQNLDGVAAALTGAGIPYDVLSTTDLTEAGGTAGVETLIVPNVAHADEPTAEGLRRFVEGGGRAILTGSFATMDPLGRPADFAAARALTEPLRLVAVPIREWALEGFEPEGASHIWATQPTAHARLAFDGAAGRYRAYVSMTDENDGTSPWRLSVGEKVVGEGLLDIEDNQPHWFATPAFELAPGDTVTLTIDHAGGEMGRTHAVVLAAADSEDGATVGRGSVAYQPAGLETLPSAELAALLRPAVRLPEPGRVTINAMAVPDGGLRTIHLVNYGFDYEVERPGVVATDDGSSEARTYFSGQPNVVRKRLTLPDPTALTEPVLQVYAYATANCDADLVVSVNGREAGRIPTEGARDWMELPLAPELLATDNVIEIRAEGELDQNRWVQIGIDTDAAPGGSEFSTDGGQTFTTADLSPDLKAQTGEYLIRIVDKRPEGGESDPTNLARNPGFEQVSLPHSETTLTVVPARDVAVAVSGAPQPALAISPDGPPQWVAGEARGGQAVYTVPQVAIWQVLVLGDRARLEALAAAQQAAAPWDIPPVTAPLRAEVKEWQPYVDGFAPAEGGYRGDHSVTCANADEEAVRGVQQTIELSQTEARPITLTAWSRAENVSGARDAHYALYVDATLADGSPFHGRHTPFNTGSHDWEQATLRLEPPGPLKSMKVFLLFRKHSGQVWFDEVTVREE